MGSEVGNIMTQLSNHKISRQKLQEAKELLAQLNIGSHSENTILHSCQLTKQEVPRFLQHLKDIDKVSLGNLDPLKYGDKAGKMLMPIRSSGGGKHNVVMGFVLKEKQSDGTYDFHVAYSTISLSITQPQDVDREANLNMVQMTR